MRSRTPAREPASARTGSGVSVLEFFGFGGFRAFGFMSFDRRCVVAIGLVVFGIDRVGVVGGVHLVGFDRVVGRVVAMA